MKWLLPLILLFTANIVLAQQVIPISSLTYPQSAFDSDTCCWRKLSAKGKYHEAAELILAYLAQNKKVENKHSLNWHAGQLYAMDKQNELAKEYMQKTYSSFYRWFGGKEGKMWYYYASGTVAFLDRDKNRLAAIEKKWNKKYPPALNYLALAALLENWDQLYKDVNRKI